MVCLSVQQIHNKGQRHATLVISNKEVSEK